MLPNIRMTDYGYNSLQRKHEINEIKKGSPTIRSWTIYSDTFKVEVAGMELQKNEAESL